MLSLEEAFDGSGRVASFMPCAKGRAFVVVVFLLPPIIHGGHGKDVFFFPTLDVDLNGPVVSPGISTLSPRSIRYMIVSFD
jgi:hypothetical protein